MLYRCPVCNGSGVVEPGFGGSPTCGTVKQCPACKGTGLQYERAVSYPERHSPKKKSLKYEI
jgi:DnaJ-class molecular chaperone